MDSTWAWEKALRETEIIRSRVLGLQTFSETHLPYILLSPSMINGGDTVVRTGEVLVHRPSLILPPNIPQLEGFDFDDQFLMLRGISLPSMKYDNKIFSLNVFEGKMDDAKGVYGNRLQREENTSAGLICGPDDVWQFSLLIFVCSQIAKNSSTDIRRLLDEYHERLSCYIMNKNDYLVLEMMTLQRLVGRLTLMLTDHEREGIVKAALEEVLKDEGQAFQAGMMVADSKHAFVKKLLSYGIIEDLLFNADVEDIIINALKPIYIHHSQKGFIATDKIFHSQKELSNFVQKLLIFAGRKSYNKIANLELANLAGRVNIIDSPLGVQLTITKAKMDPLSIIDLIRRGTMTYEAAGQLWLYLEGLSIRPANIIISGGPGTGKTTLLNALLSFIPEKDRLVVIEDTLELNTFMEDSCSRLETDDELSLSDLVKNSLRMRPERIIVGEVRGAEARDMITAVNIGKYCMGTIHALSARETITRLQNEPMNVSEVLVNLIDVFIILKRYHVKGKLFRVIDEISETGGMESKQVLLSHVYKYNYEQNRVMPVSPSTIYRDRLANEVGMTPRDIINETWVRAAVLKTLDNRDIHTIKEVSTFCRFYAVNPKEAMVKIGLDRDRMLKDLGK